MAQFDLQSYRTVDERIAEFYAMCPEGSIRTFLSSKEGPEVIFEARVYRNNEEAIAGIYSSGWSHEVEGRSPVNKTSFVENAECVPLTVPALTRSGWQYYHQLREGDEVLTYDVEAGVLVWDLVQKISTFPSQALVRIGNSRFRADCTPNHKWVIDGKLHAWNARPGKALEKIRLAARFAPRASERVEDAARLGWLFGDCVIRYSKGIASRAEITQAKPENFDMLNSLFGEPRVKARAGVVREWGEERTSTCREAMCWAVPAAETRRILGLFQVNAPHDLPEAVLGMTSEEADAFLDSMQRSDGHKGRYGKTCPHRCTAVQLAMFITGHCTSSVSEATSNSMTTRPCFIVNMHRTGEKYLSEFQETVLPPQDVWCPTTGKGTWVGLFDGRPAITGNTSAVGRALANLGFTGNGKRPSRSEMEKVVRVKEEHEAYLNYIRTQGVKAADDAEITIQGEEHNLKKYVQQNWSTIKERYPVARAVVEAIEASTGESFAKEDAA